MTGRPVGLSRPRSESPSDREIRALRRRWWRGEIDYATYNAHLGDVDDARYGRILRRERIVVVAQGIGGVAAAIGSLIIERWTGSGPLLIVGAGMIWWGFSNLLRCDRCRGEIREFIRRHGDEESEP